MRIDCFAVVLSAWVMVTGGWVKAAEPDSSATKSAVPKTVRLLTIGNSFSQDATAFLGNLAAADGNRLILKTANIGGSPLQLHWEKAELHDRDPNHPDGLYRDGRSLKMILLDGPHDFVTIQQRSYISHDITTYRPYAARLQAYVKQHAPQAELLLHQTWAYRRDDPQFTAKPKPGDPRTQQEMYDKLAQAYRAIAAELGVRLIPVGDAFFAADSDPQWGFRVDPRFDVDRATPPNLPDQTHSLHVGLKWLQPANQSPRLSMDGHHASPAGRYLAACVWYEVLFKTSCLGNRFTASLDPKYAAFLQATAHRAAAQQAAALQAESTSK